MSSSKSSGKEPKCICPECPSHHACSGKNELAFCFEGKSACLTEEKGCLCISCPVQKKYDFDKVYYCLRGSFKDLVK